MKRIVLAAGLLVALLGSVAKAATDPYIKGWDYGYDGTLNVLAENPTAGTMYARRKIIVRRIGQPSNGWQQVEYRDLLSVNASIRGDGQPPMWLMRFDSRVQRGMIGPNGQIHPIRSGSASGGAAGGSGGSGGQAQPGVLGNQVPGSARP